MMDRPGIAAAVPQAWTLWQLFLPSLMSVSRADQPEDKFRRAEGLATIFSLGLTVGLCGIRGSWVPLLAWAIGVPVMALLYEWSYQTPSLTFDPAKVAGHG